MILAVFFLSLRLWASVHPKDEWTLMHQQLSFLHLPVQNVGRFTRQSPTWLGPGASYFTETLCIFIIGDFGTDL